MVTNITNFDMRTFLFDRLGSTRCCSLLKFVNFNLKRTMSDQAVLKPYVPPEWASGLLNIPKYRTSLAMLNTPIHKWTLPGVPDGFELYIKRDDMTGSTLSGNKVRKLEFIFADAIQKGCKNFITCGSLQSNYCRAATIAATQLGLKTHLVLRAEADTAEEAGCQGNVFINRLCGADMYLVPKKASYATELLPRMQQIAANIKETTGEESYISEVGGSDAIGFYGYLQSFEELISQGVQENFDDIVFTAGSGGTAEGLAAGNHFTGSKVKIHGIAVCDNTQIFHEHANSTFSQVGLKDLKSEDVLDIIDDFKGKGYGVATQEIYDFISEVAKTTGIILDPTYTGKAAHGLVKDLQANPERYRGKRVLFIHTGGIFGAYDGRLESELMKSASSGVHIWKTLEQSPF